MFSIEPDETRRQADNLAHAEETLERIRASLAEVHIPKSVGGRQAATIQRSIDRATAAVRAEQRSVAAYASALETMVGLYESAEQNATSKLPKKGSQSRIARSGDENPAEDSVMFDDEGGYGGNQSDMKDNQSGIKILWFRLFKNEELFDAVREYEGYEDYTDSQIIRLFEQISQEGCGYVAIANSIFVQYEDDPDEFERVFGFPMYGDDGEPNFNRLILDFFCTTDDKFYLDEQSGDMGFVCDVLNSFRDRPEDFEEIYGVEPFADEHNYNVEAMQAVLDEYQDETVVEHATNGTNPYALENRMMHYLKEKGVDATCIVDRGEYGPDEVDGLLEEGNCVNILTGDFSLYDSEGNVIQSGVGDHWMTITDVTEDGNYVVSSWGHEYYIHPGDLSYHDLIIMDVVDKAA